MKVTVAATQFACTPNPAENLARAESMVRKAAAKGAQVILLQELFETPYFCKDHLASHFELAHPLPDNPVVRHFQALAKELEVHVTESWKEAVQYGTLTDGPRLNRDLMFQDVFKEMPEQLRKQREQLRTEQGV